MDKLLEISRMISLCEISSPNNTEPSYGFIKPEICSEGVKKMKQWDEGEKQCPKLQEKTKNREEEIK